MFFAGLAATGAARAQGDIAPELLDRPPVAAPTSKIDVGSIPVVLSASQEMDNFAAGLMQGLMFGSGIKGIGLVVVKEDRVLLQRYVGSMAPDRRFPANASAPLFDAITAMQLIERGTLTASEDVGKALGESAPRSFTVGDLLAFKAGDPELLSRVVDKASGAEWPDYVTKQIAQPLGMTATAVRNGRMETSPADLGRLAAALENDGAGESGRIFQPMTLDSMEATHASLHPALPGRAYGFSEMRRNGWRALQRDGASGAIGVRLVIVPEAKAGYFVVVEGPTTPAFWRVLDNGLFDKLLPSRNTPEPSISGPAPSPEDALRVEGTYEPVRDAPASLAGLAMGDRLSVRANASGGLLLTGAERATLAPKPGGYWGSADGNLNAVARGGQLVLSTGAYGALALYKRPASYGWLALVAALASLGFVMYGRRLKPAAPLLTDSVLELAGAAVLLALVAAVVWLFSPSA